MVKVTRDAQTGEIKGWKELVELLAKTEVEKARANVHYLRAEE